jgi:hypothetical protein
MTRNESGPAWLKKFITDPDAFFCTLAGQPPHYRGPLVIVFTAGILSAISTWLVMSWMFSSVSEGFSGLGPEYRFMSSFFGILIIFASACAVFGALVTAIVAGFVFYILAGFITKGGSLVHTITAAAWGMVPLAFYEMLQIPLFLAFRPGMSVTISRDFFTMMGNSTSASTVDKEAMMNMITFSQTFYSYAMVNAGLHLLAWLCCAWFWIPAVRNTCGVEQRQAALIVLIPLLVYLAVTTGPVLMSGGHGL